MDKLEQIRELFKESQGFLNALGDPIRQELLLNMMGHEFLSVKDLASRTKLARPTISHHLKIMKDANIISEIKNGRQTFYRPQVGDKFYVVKELIETIDTVIEEEKVRESR